MRRRLSPAWLLICLYGSGCGGPPAAPTAGAASPAEAAPEDPPYAEDSVFRPETHRSAQGSPAGALRVESTIRPGDPNPFSYFGQAVAVAGDLAVVGAPYDDEAGLDVGAAYVFRRRPGGWAQEAKLAPPGPRMYDRFGYSVAVSGEHVLVGADRRDEGGRSESGAAYVFTRGGAGWRLEATLRPRDLAEGDGLGIAVAISRDAALVGAPGKSGSLVGEGAAYVFRRSAAGWREEAKLADPAPTERGGFGAAVALDGDSALVGAPASHDLAVLGGRAYLFRRAGRDWEIEARLGREEPQPLERFGASVALAGDLAVAGAPRATLGEKTRAGAVSLFRRHGAGWQLEAELGDPQPRSDEEFGRAVSLAGGSLARESLIVGAHFGDAAGLNTGVVFLFDKVGQRWETPGPVLAVDAHSLDEFGFAVALSPRWLLVGAPREDSAGSASGCAYVHARQEPAAKGGA